MSHKGMASIKFTTRCS